VGVEGDELGLHVERALGAHELAPDVRFEHTSEAPSLGQKLA
jgi:hypothetical protein